MPIFGGVIGFIAGLFAGSFILSSISFIVGFPPLIGSIIIFGLAVYVAWLGYKMLPI